MEPRRVTGPLLDDQPFRRQWALNVVKDRQAKLAAEAEARLKLEADQKGDKPPK